METILVTTDLSANSVSAIRFAHKLCLLRGATMVVLYVDQLPVPTDWSIAEISAYLQKRQQLNQRKAQSFVNLVCRTGKKPMVPTQIEVNRSTSVVDSIISCGKANNCRYICISTHGAGKMKSLVGTHTSKLIERSPLPVICIPSGYRSQKIKMVCYVSDLADFQKEIRQVLQFSAPIGAGITLMHLTIPGLPVIADMGKLQEELKEIAGEAAELKLIERNIVHSLHYDIELAIKKNVPSLVVFFTQKKHSFFDKLFHHSAAELQSFTTKIPMISFRK